MIIKKNWLYGGAVVAAVVALWMAFGSSEEYSREDVLALNLAEHKNLALHIHPQIILTFNKENLAIPAGIGISPNGMRVIHTHEPDGNLHIESPFPYQFSLGDFFTIWEKRLTAECVFQYCTNDSHILRFYVNGEETTLGPDIPLYDLDKIEIVYEERA
jgi:hypothetical protein